MEFHQPLEEDGLSFEENYQNALQTAHQSLDAQNLRVADDVIRAVVKEESGLPVEVTLTQE